MSEHDILRVHGINSKGFGTVPKLVMQDERLSIQAKAIYSYFCSYAGMGQTAFPRVTKIIKDLGIAKNTYYTHFNQLKECGYIGAEQEHRNGRLTRNIYTIFQEVIQCTKIQDTVKQDTEIQDTVFCDTKYLSNSIKNNSIKNNRVRDAPAPVNTFGEYGMVKLTPEQRQKLVTAYGEARTADYIGQLDSFIASTGKTYTNHYATLDRWIKRDVGKPKTDRPAAKHSRFVNFEQRQWDFNAIEQNERRLLEESARKGDRP